MDINDMTSDGDFDKESPSGPGNQQNEASPADKTVFEELGMAMGSSDTAEMDFGSGDHVKDGKVYIDGSPTPLDDSFIPEKMIGSYGPYTVPENSYFMLGDNRNDSKDSRSWKNKFVRFDQLVGKAIVRYYPSFKWLG